MQYNPETGVSRGKFASAARRAPDPSYNTPEAIQGTATAFGLSNRSIRQNCFPCASIVLPADTIVRRPRRCELWCFRESSHSHAA